MIVYPFPRPFIWLLCAAASQLSGSITYAQTQIWSEPTRTEAWSEGQPATAPEKSENREESEKSGQAAETRKTQIWSAPVKTRKIKKFEPEAIKTHKKVDPRLVGTWNLRIPTAVGYSTDGVRTYRHTKPGANFDRLIIRANNSYHWGKSKGNLKEVRPWFANQGQRYFEVAKDKQNIYLVRFDEHQKTLAMFFDVGGYVARGTRVSTANASATKTPAPNNKKQAVKSQLRSRAKPPHSNVKLTRKR